ncbi:MAG: ELWxxDGT repeat protein [Chloroflexota bacterium]
MSIRTFYLALRVIIICAYFVYIGFTGLAWAQQIGQQTPLLLTDEHLGPASSSPHSFIQFKGETYFGLAGKQGGLWKTDGTADGTILVKDIRLYEPIHRPPYEPTKYHDAPVAASEEFLFFVVDQGPLVDTFYHEYELWRSDGTSSGTFLVHSFQSEAWRFWDFAVFDGVLYFRESDPEHGAELWRSDGTIDGTHLFLDINQGVEDSNPQNFTVWDDQFYFTAFEPLNGYNVWQTDGTTEGTYIAIDIDEGSEHLRQINDLVVANGSLYFDSYYLTIGGELWQSDGTITGTHLITSSYPSPITGLNEVNNKLFYGLRRNLWHTDGTEENTAHLLQTEVGGGIYGRFPGDNLLYFTGSVLQGTSYNRTLWRSDGTADGTFSLDAPVPYLQEIEVVGDNAYFLASSDSGNELWYSDGTSEGTGMIKDIVPSELDNATLRAYPSPIYSIDDGVLFGVDDGIVGKELWQSDGSPDGTTLFKDIDANSLGTNLDVFASSNDTINFFSSEKVNNRIQNSLWRSDGTVSGTNRIKSFDPESSYYAPSIRAETVGSTFYFIFDSVLWKSDGTLEDTVILEDRRVYNLAALNSLLYFTKDNELWRSDGTVQGTESIKQINISNFPPLYPSGQTLFFSATDREHGYELWKSDGTEAGTVLIKDIHEGFASAYPESLFFHDGHLYFSAYGDDYDGRELWRSDGTESGTELIKVIASGLYNGSQPQGFAGISISDNTRSIVGTNYVIFSADHQTYGRELWRTDGTEEGTELVVDIHPGSDSSLPAAITSMGDYVLFRANDGLNGSELWRSDGTAEGTSLVSDIRLGTYGSQIGPPLRVGDSIYFSADDGIHGAELWTSDGTASSTMMLFDLYPGMPGSNPSDLTYSDGILYFSADDGVNGRQLHSISVLAPLSLDVVDEPEETSPLHIFHYIPFFSNE